MRNVLLSLAQAFVVGSYRQMNLYKKNYINRPRVACGFYKIFVVMIEECRDFQRLCIHFFPIHFLS